MAQLKQRVRDVVAAALWWSGVTRPQVWGKRRLPVVTFHRVLPAEVIPEAPLPEIAITPEELAWVLDFFSDHFRCLPLGQAVAAHGVGDASELPPIAITFDDGTRDNFEYAAPVLQEAGAHASFFVVPENAREDRLLWPDRVGYSLRALLRREGGGAHAERLATTHGIHRPNVGDAEQQVRSLVAALKTLPADRVDAFADALDEDADPTHRPAWEGMMTFDQIRAMRDAGHEIGSHSLTHPILTRCDDDRLRRECEESRRVLREELGCEADTFCYPNGNRDARVVQAVRDAGFRLAVTTQWGTNSASADPLTLKRYDIDWEVTGRGNRVPSTRRLAWRLSGLHRGLRQ